MRKMLLAVALVFSVFAVFGEVAETRYSADGGETWTEGTLTAAVTAANKNADTIIELNKNVSFPAGSQLTFERASQKVLLRSNRSVDQTARYTITRTADVSGSTQANLKLNANSVSLTIENVLIDLNGTAGNVIATMGSKAGDNSSVALGEGVEIFNAKMGGTVFIQLIAASSSLTLDGAVIRNVTGASAILYASSSGDGSSIIINAGGIKDCDAPSGNNAIVYLNSKNGTFKMTGGFIKDNTAADTVIKTPSSSAHTVNISGGEITGNTLGSKDYGAIKLTKAANFSGCPVISNNLAKTTEKNINGSSSYIKQSGNLTEGAYIGVTSSSSTDVNGQFGSLTTAGLTGAEHFHCDGKDLIGSAAGTALKWAEVPVEPPPEEPTEEPTAIALVSPANAATVALLSDYQKGWLALDAESRVKALAEESGAPAAYDKIIKTADFSYGTPVKLTWEPSFAETAKGGGCKVTVTVKKGDAVVASVETTETSAEIFNLELGATYTWTVTAGTVTSDTFIFTTEAATPRIIKSGTMTSVRDLGGWTGLKGCKVKANQIFRGGPPNENKSTSPASLLDAAAIDFWQNQIGLKTEIDFRSSSEHASTSPMESLGANYLKYNIAYYTAYAPSETSSGNGKNFFNTLQTILTPAKRPVYFHCAYGRDRTGTIASLVLAILGVSEEDILDDYHATTIRSSKQPREYYEDFAAFRTAIKTAYPADTFAESVEQYFRALGITQTAIENFRKAMLEGYATQGEDEPVEPKGLARADAEKRPVRILILGNSFSRFLGGYQSALDEYDASLKTAANALGREADVVAVFGEGCALGSHWEEHALTTCYRYIYSTYDSANNPFANYGNCGLSLDTILTMEDWDIITIQQSSPNSNTVSTYEPYLGHLVDLFHEKAPHAELFFHQTWAYSRYDTRFNGSIAGRDKMYDDINAAVQATAVETYGMGVIPTGYAVQLYRYRNQDTVDTEEGTDVTSTDHHHLKPEYEQIVTWTFAQRLFGAVPSPDGVPTSLKSCAADAGKATDYTAYKAKSPAVVAPANGATVALLTDFQKLYLADTSSTRLSYLADDSQGAAVVPSWAGWPQDKYVYYAFTSFGSPVTLAWTDTEGEATVVVTGNSDHKTYLNTKTATQSAMVYNLIPGESYTWTVTAANGAMVSATFTAEANAPRLIRAGGIRALRDLGGWTGLQGKKVRFNQIFRGGPANVAADDTTESSNARINGNTRVDEQARDAFYNLIGMKTEIDLRRADEHKGDYKFDMTGEKIEYLDDNIDSYHLYKRAELEDPTSEYYARGIAWTNLLHVIMDASKRPVYFHCAWGRDRTGTVAAILEAVLGLSYNDIMTDYQLTTKSEKEFGGNKVVRSYYSSFQRLLGDSALKGYTGANYAEKAKSYLISIGFTDEEIETFRTEMLDGYKTSGGDVPVDPGEKPLNILVIGNSFSIFLGQSGGSGLAVAAHALGHKVNVAALYSPGCTLENHWKHHASSFYGDVKTSFDSALTPVTTGMSLDEILAANDWDIVTLQQGSAESNKLDTYEPYLGNLINLIRAKAPHAEIKFHETWAYSRNEPDFGGDVAKRDAMYDAINANVQATAVETYGLDVIPTGYAIQLYRYRNQVMTDAADVTQGDYHHLKGDCEYIATWTFCQRIFGAVPSPDGVPTSLKSCAVDAAKATDFSDYGQGTVDFRWTVTFKDDDGTILSSQTVSNRVCAVAPSFPERDEQTPLGWVKTGTTKAIASDALNQTPIVDNVVYSLLWRKGSDIKPPEGGWPVDIDKPEGDTFFARLANDPRRVGESKYAVGGDFILKVAGNENENEFIHVFTNASKVSQFIANVPLDAKMLLVAGGGAGGYNTGAGGGAGGLVAVKLLSLEVGHGYRVQVGAGGMSSTDNDAPSTAGGNSAFLTSASEEIAGIPIALGGGKGGGYNNSTTASLKGLVCPGGNGGSGGGAYSTYAAGAGTDGQGFAGCKESGGGGGAGGPASGKTGGEGLEYGLAFLGYEQYFAGGGGGGSSSSDTSACGAGGLGGGGAGTCFSKSQRLATAGEDGLGGGGGGGGGGANIYEANKLAGKGGDGVVIIRYVAQEEPTGRIVPVPEARTGLVYNGEAQTGVEAGDGYRIEGNVATSAGDYEAVASLDDAEGSQWSDRTVADKRIQWSIAKAQAVLTGKVTVQDWMQGTTPAPSGIVASIGEVQYRYYLDAGCTQVVEGIPTKLGTYYVRAEVEDDSNIMGAVSEAARVQLIKYYAPAEKPAGGTFNARLLNDSRLVTGEAAEKYATGADLVFRVGKREQIFIFTNATEAATFTTKGRGTADILVVAGGGAGGYNAGAGGGAGGAVYRTDVSLKGAYMIQVGKGGTTATDNNTHSASGEDSVFGSLTAVGGGAGGGYSATKNSPVCVGWDGGSGGGGYKSYAGGAGTDGQGNVGYGSDSANPGGGGGAGDAATSRNGGAGRTFYLLGYAETFAGGGGAGCDKNASQAIGGLGGGGAGGYYIGKTSTAVTAKSGEDGLGAGGGGGGGGGNASDANKLAGKGGDGIVIIYYTAVQTGSAVLIR